jgi:predicted dehydrogenase
MSKQPRRKFIRQTAAVAVAAPFISTAVTRALAQASDRKIGFALCGLGTLSTGQIAPALQKTKHCRLAGIVTGTPAKAEKWKAQYNIPDRSIYNYDTMEKMADNPDIDVVYVVTPNALHGEHTLKAAKAGKHVLSEKPMEVSVQKCQQMIDACKSANRMLAIGYRCRFDPLHLECIRLAREKTFGNLKLIEASFEISLGGDASQWRLKKDLSGGGALMDVGIYALQATRFLTGEEPISVTGMTALTNPTRFNEVEETVLWTQKFPSGVSAFCAASYNANFVGKYRAIAERGWFELDPGFFYDGNRGRRSDNKEFDQPAVDQFAEEMDNFAQCILNRQATIVPGEEGLRDVKILLSIYDAIRTGQTQTLQT